MVTFKNVTEPELPCCPVCGMDVVTGEPDSRWIFWSYRGVDSEHFFVDGFSTKQEAIDAFWATPYGKLVMEKEKNHTPRKG